MRFEDFLATHPIFTLKELIDFAKKNGQSLNRSTLHNSLAYHQKQGHILHIRRGLYYTTPKGTNPQECPIDSFLVASKMTEDAILGYRTALDLHGKLHTISNEFIYLSKKRMMAPFVFKEIKYQAVSVPTALLISKNEQFGVQSIDRLGQKISVTSFERTLVDVLDRPHLCGSWEEIWLSLESIEYLDMEEVLKYVLLLANSTTIAKLGFFLEAHQKALMIPDDYLQELMKYRPLKPHYMDRNHNQPQKMIAKWNLIVPLSLINREWEEPNEDI